jgi:glycosyltransferase involved in cell wall biosynthesis
MISGKGVNGAVIYCKLLADALADRGHEITLLTRSGSWIAEQQYAENVRVLSSPMTRFPLTELHRINNLVRDDQIDLMHTHMTRAHSFGVLLRMLTGVPVVATAHSRHFEVHWRFNDFVIANSQSTFDYHHRVNRLSKHRMQTVHCFSDLKKFEGVSARRASAVRQQLELSDNDLLAGVIGQVTKRKGHLHLFRALPEIVRQIPNFKLAVVGEFTSQDPYARRLQRLLEQEQLTDCVLWLGGRENIADYMTACDLTIVPSIEEPLGLVAMESLAAGTPVVASRTGGLTEIVEHGETGLLVPPGKDTALAEAIIKLAGSEQLRERLGAAGQQMARARFAPEPLLDQVEAIYLRVTSPRPRAA